MKRSSSQTPRVKFSLGTALTVIGMAVASVAHAQENEIFKHSSTLFSDFYRSNGWNSDGTRSGPGSTLESTHALRPALSALLRKYQIKSFLDIPCGDFWWMREVALEDVSYIGMDIVPEMIEANQAQYGSEDGQVRFAVGHLSTSQLPQVDLVMVRDVLIHQPLALAKQSLQNLVKSGSRWALISTYTRHNDNFEIEEGNWRPLNLMLAPFNLPEPTEIIDEQNPEADGAYSDKVMGLWRIEDLQKALSAQEDGHAL